MREKVGGDTGRAADFICPKGYSKACSVIMLSNKAEGKVGQGPALGDHPSILQLVVSNSFHLHCLFFLGFVFFSLLFSLPYDEKRIYNCCYIHA